MSVCVELLSHLMASDLHTIPKQRSVFGRRTSMDEEMVKDLFHSIEEFMNLQQSPSASLIDGFPIIAKYLPRPLQWYRPRAERIFNETVR